MSTVNPNTFLRLNKRLTTGGRDFVLFFSVEYDPDSKRKNHVLVRLQPYNKNLNSPNGLLYTCLKLILRIF